MGVSERSDAKTRAIPSRILCINKDFLFYGSLTLHVSITHEQTRFVPGHVRDHGKLNLSENLIAT